MSLKKHLRWVGLARSPSASAFSIAALRRMTTHLRFGLALVIAVAGCGDKEREPNILPLPPDANVDARDANDELDGNEKGDASDVRNDEASDALGDAPVCGPRTELGYNMPGCGANAPSPRCRELGDPCASPVCDCNGVTKSSGCGYSQVPFASWGACSDGSADAGDAADAGDGGRADSDVTDDDALSDADMRPDGLMCGAGEDVAYNKPGCGANAPAPYCQGSTDACAGWVCDCTGVTRFAGCGFSYVPYMSWGLCPDGGLDASAD